MKKILLLLIFIVTLSACTPPPKAEDIYSQTSGVIEKIENGKITVNTENERIEIVYNDAKASDTGKNITIDYKNGEIENINIYGVPFESEAEEIIEEMTLEEKVGQLFLVRYPHSGAEDIAKNYNIGGFVLFARDFENETPESILEEISLCQQASKYPMLMAVDEEGGIVVRVSKFSQFREKPFPSPSYLYEEGGFDAITNDTYEKCNLLKSIGINVNLAPVADVSTDKRDYIYNRTTGLDAEGTSEYIKTVVSVMKEEKTGSVLKHFPGYGNNTDTHTGIAVDKRDYNSFLSSDFLPFIAGIESGADSILVSHNIVESIDSERPASLSPKAHDILRNVLGFNGVVMTDDLDMSAITQYTDSEGAAIDAIKAGNDMVICSDYKTQINAVINAVNSGEISEKTINKAVQRVIIWKLKLDLI
ncbi:MAG: beta-hexosaminidase [Lachnospiraceae bacterium]|nr:beta-hexosaminidase [Lachnospiraceae bacterium]